MFCPRTRCRRCSVDCLANSDGSSSTVNSPAYLRSFPSPIYAILKRTMVRRDHNHLHHHCHHYLVFCHHHHHTSHSKPREVRHCHPIVDTHRGKLECCSVALLECWLATTRRLENELRWQPNSSSTLDDRRSTTANDKRESSAVYIYI